MVQQGLWFFLINNFAKKKDLDPIIQRFMTVDKNGDGDLSHAEMISEFRNAFKLSLKRRDSGGTGAEGFDSALGEKTWNNKKDDSEDDGEGSIDEEGRDLVGGKEEERDRRIAKWTEEFEEKLVGIMEKLEGCDVNGDGSVSYFEFCSFSFDQSLLLTKENLRLAFDMIDVDKGGTLDPKELMFVIKNSYPFYSEQKIQDIEMQLSFIGELSYAEFEELMLSELIKNTGSSSGNSLSDDSESC
jgi:Ca2+-binding EF-hand superfamily protein